MRSLYVRHSLLRISLDRAHLRMQMGQMSALQLEGLAEVAVRSEQSAASSPCDHEAPREPACAHHRQRVRTPRDLLVLLPVDLGAEVAYAHPQSSQESHHGMPAHAASAVLDLGHVRHVDP